jgi:D-alanyl-D-alanine carboxypeptidase (penicillin-binding protein 5/6)/beta-lactamase class A
MLARIAVAIAFIALPAVADAQEKSLADRLTPLIQAHHGKVAVAVLHLDDGVSYDYDGDEVMPTASMIKFMIMLEVYQQVAEGKVKLADKLVLHDADKVPGSGILTYHFSDGAAFPLRDAVRLMIAYSDNTATNLVLDHIGIDSTNRRMAAWGFANSRINAKVYLGSKTSVDPARTKKYGLGSTTPKETVKLLEKLYKGQCGDKQATKDMLDHLKKCEYHDMIRRFLPPSVVVANKTGSVSDAKTDMGILYFPGGPVAICVMTKENRDRRFQPDNEASILIGRIAEQVYLHYVKTPKK